MGENDYQTGYRGGQYHHGMDRGEYERGKGQRETEDAVGRMAGGGQPVEVPGVAWTLILASPIIWTVYPVLGLTLYAVVGAMMGLCFLFHIPKEWALFPGLIIGVMSFFPGLKLELMASQITAYRWFRGFLRIFLTCGLTTALSSGSNLNKINVEPSALTGGFTTAVIVFIVFQRLDLMYFPARAEIKKLQEKIAKGERPQRPKLKRVFFGFCWLLPTIALLLLLEGVVIRLFMNAIEGRELWERLRPVLAWVNFAVWVLLFLTGKLPGTGKYAFSKQREENILEMSTDAPSDPKAAAWSQGK